MKLLHATAEVTVLVQFTSEEATALLHAAEHHYDAAFRTLPALASIKYSGENKDEWGARLTWRDLDILSKICESPLAPDDVSCEVWAMFTRLRTLARQAQATIDKEHK